ncbi:unnamed protein product, partial [Owenia fusiformis]
VVPEIKGVQTEPVIWQDLEYNFTIDLNLSHEGKDTSRFISGRNFQVFVYLGDSNAGIPTNITNFVDPSNSLNQPIDDTISVSFEGALKVSAEECSAFDADRKVTVEIIPEEHLLELGYSVQTHQMDVSGFIT